MIIKGLVTAGMPDPVGASNLHDCDARTAVARAECVPCTAADGRIRDQLATRTNAVDVGRHGCERADSIATSAGVADDPIRGGADDVVRWRFIGPATLERLGGLPIENTPYGEKRGNGRDAPPTDSE